MLERSREHREIEVKNLGFNEVLDQDFPGDLTQFHEIGPTPHKPNLVKLPGFLCDLDEPIQ